MKKMMMMMMRRSSSSSSRLVALVSVLLAASAAPGASSSYRSIDGSGNNAANPSMGSQNTAFSRWAAADYEDGVSSFAGPSRPNPRDVSSAIFAQAQSIESKNGLSDLIWQWGQFLDHDLTLTPVPHAGSQEEEVTPISIPAGDEFFDPMGSGNQTIDFTRSLFDAETGNSTDNPRQQVNIVTDWIDASQVYGSDDARAASLRAFVDGLLLTSSSDSKPGEFLPINSDLLPNENFVDDVADEVLFLGGDLRANDQIGLMAMHTLFVREHNRLARALKVREGAERRAGGRSREGVNDRLVGCGVAYPGCQRVDERRGAVPGRSENCRGGNAHHHIQ